MISGAGLGLRSKHFNEILNTKPAVPWFEVVADQFLYSNGPHIDKLQEISQHYPIVVHSLGLSIGSLQAVDGLYLKKLKSLVSLVNAHWLSDHCSWGVFNQQQLYQLLPVPYTDASLQLIADKAKLIQDTLGIPFALENPSSYVTFKDNKYSEAEFLQTLAERANIKCLLDINNIIVTCHNQGHLEQAEDYFKIISKEHILQMHIAGFEVSNTLLIDSHSQSISSETWQLLSKALSQYGAIATSIEWDSNIPEWQALFSYQQKLQGILDRFPAIAPNTTQQQSIEQQISPVRHHLSEHHKRQASLVAAITKNISPENIFIENNNLEERLVIYRNDYYQTVIQAYKKIFMATARLVGDDYLESLLYQFIQKHHFTNPDISAHAADFCLYVNSNQHVKELLPYLADFVKYEWYWYLAFHQQSPSVLTLESKYPLAEIWQMCQPDYQGEIKWPDNISENYVFKFESIRKKVYEAHVPVM